MRAERNSLGGSFQEDPHSLPSIVPTEESQMASKSSCDSLARPFIPAGPATALAMPPTLRRRAVS